MQREHELRRERQLRTLITRLVTELRRRRAVRAVNCPQCNAPALLYDDATGVIPIIACRCMPNEMFIWSAPSEEDQH